MLAYNPTGRGHNDADFDSMSLDELMFNEEFGNELVEAMNENFVLEVEASRAYERLRDAADSAA